MHGLPRLGDCWNAGEIARITALKPTIAIGSVPFRTNTVDQLLKQAFAFLALNPRRLADIARDVRLLGRLTGATAGAERLISRMDLAFARIRRESAGKQRLQVHCEAWPKPRISSPPWVAELVELTGSEMAVPAGARISDAEVASANPDVIVLAWAATGARARTKSTYANRAWSAVPAIVNRHVFVVRDEWLNTPGPPLLYGARELARICRLVRRAKEKT